MTTLNWEEIRKGQQAKIAKLNQGGSSLVFGNQGLPAAGSNFGAAANSGTNAYTTPDSTFKSAQPYLPLLNKYFLEEDIPKAVWTGFWESGFQNKSALEPGSDGATGIFRIQNLPGRPTPAELMNPETNIRYAAELLYGPGGKNNPNAKLKKNWEHWGDNGALFEGKPFGALSVHPYPGDGNVPMPASPLPPDYQTNLRVWTEVAQGYAETRQAVEQQKLDFESSTKAGGLLQQQAVDIVRKENPDKTLSQLHTEGIYAKKLKELESEANDKVDVFNKEIARIADEEKLAALYLNVLGSLDQGVADSDTNIKSYDDLIKSIAPTWKEKTGKDFPGFNEQQAKYLNTVINHLAPYLNTPGNPITQQQFVEFLAVAQNHNYPSRSVSIAGLSRSQIKSALTTLPGGSNQLPKGLTEETANAFLKSINILPPDQKAEIAKLKGTYKDLVAKWAEQDNKYEAYKLGLASPSNLNLLKNRSQSVGQWAFEMLDVVQSNVARPLVGYGASGIGSLNDLTRGALLGSNMINVLGSIGDINLPKIGNINPYPALQITGNDIDKLRANIRANRSNGQNFWEAAGNAEQSWEINGFTRFFLETVADPTTYIGFGIFPKIAKATRIPLLGASVEGFEKGWMHFWDNPLVAKVGLTATGAGIGYAVSGGDEKAALLGSVVGLTPIMRGIKLFTPKQLVEKTLVQEGGIMPNLREAIVIHNDIPTASTATADHIRNAIAKGIEGIRTNPLADFLNPATRAVKGILDATTPWIDQSWVGQTRARLSAAVRERMPIVEKDIQIALGEEAPETLISPASRKGSTKVTNDQLTQLNDYYSRMLNSADRGILHIDQVTDNFLQVLGLPESLHGEMKTILNERLESSFDNLTKMLVGDDPDRIIKTIFSESEKGLTARYSNELWRHSVFQGYVNGIMSRVDPITRNQAYRVAAWIQGNYARSMLWFFSFKPMNLLETWFRAGLSGGGWSLPVHADEVFATNRQVGWHRSFPYALQHGGRGRLEYSLSGGAERSVMDEVLKKQKGWVSTMSNLLESMPKIEDQLRAKAYRKWVLEELAYSSPESYRVIKETADGVRESLYRNTSLSQADVENIVSDVTFASLRPDAPDYIRKMATDLDTVETRAALTEVYSKMQQYPTIDQPFQELIIRELQRGGWNDIARVMQDVNMSFMDYHLAKSELGQEHAVRFADKVIKSIDESESPEAILGLFKHINDSEDVMSSVAGSLLEIATRRSRGLHNQEAYNAFWDSAHKAMSDYLDVSNREIARMVAAIRPKAEQYLDEISRNIVLASTRNLSARGIVSEETRLALDKVFSDFVATTGHRPTHAEEWEPIISERAQIWENSRKRRNRLTKEYEALAEELQGGKIGNLVPAPDGLTIAHISQLLSSSGDEIAQSLALYDSIREKGDFVSVVAGRAEGKARAMGKTDQELAAMGWSEEAIGNVYDQLTIRMGLEVGDSPSLAIFREELKNLERDLHSITSVKSKKPEEVDTINQAYESAAQRLEASPIDSSMVDKAFEQSRLRFEHQFTDYTHNNFFDSFMKSIFPFWNYQSQRWPYLFNESIKHPGILTSLGRFNDYTENGYIHIPGQDIGMNFLRGTIFMGGMGGLVRMFPGSQETGVLGTVNSAIEQIGKAGFYPGFWATLPLAKAGFIDFDLPPGIETVWNTIGVGADLLGNDLGLIALKDQLFPNRFKDYYTATIASDLAQKRELSYNGNDVRRHIQDGSASEEEKALWEEARLKSARYQILFDQTGMFKLDPETKRAAQEEASKYIEQVTGVSPKDQDAITSRLGSSGLRLTDILPLDPAAARQLNELSKFKYWNGLSTVTKPNEIRMLQDRIDQFWEAVEGIQTAGKEKGFKSRDGKREWESLSSLDEQFRNGTLTSKDWLTKQADTRAQMFAEIEGLKQDRYYKDVPITLEERMKYYEKKGVPMPVDHPAKEIINLYYSLYPKPDPITKEPNWDNYFASVDSLIETLPSDRRAYFLDYIQKEWTPTQKLYWDANNKYVRPYRNIRQAVKNAIDPSQLSFIEQYENVDAATIKNLPEDQQKLISDYNSAVNRADQRYRQLSPTTDAWLFYWGKVTTLQSEEARLAYNDLVRRYPGPQALLVPVEEKRRTLPALP